MSNDMNDDLFNGLKDATTPDPRTEAKKRAMAAGMAAFEAAKSDAEKKFATAPQGKVWDQRLTSIITSLKGKSIMDMRIPIGTAAFALLVLPLGYQLYTTTVMTPAQAVNSQPARIEPVAVEPAPVELRVAEQAQAPTTPPTDVTLTDEGESSAGVVTVDPIVAAESMAKEERTRNSAVSSPASDMLVRPAPEVNEAPLSITMAPVTGVVASDYSYVEQSAATDPTTGDMFTDFEEQQLKVTADEPVSTFSIDVDTASYSYTRRLLEEGHIPEPDAVRIEEMINYFPYNYAPADSAQVPFKPIMAVYPTPWNPKTQVLHIGIKGYVPPVTEDRPSNLVLLIDTSGSMDEPNRLPLLKRAFGLLVDQLSANDTVSIVVYAGSAGVVLEPTVATEKAKILAALNNLAAGGSTAGAAGIELAYQLAEQAKVSGGTNRVILATDGDFNVGIENPEDLETFIKGKRDSGVTLSVVGFGYGNLGDDTMQALAQNGNGNAAYISNFREAQKVLVEEGGSTLEMIAKDVKIQVEFNPAVVAEYRLIGYETRALDREDFNNDAVDAGDIGAGHSVTAIYEITPAGSSAELVDPLRYGQAAEDAPAGGEIAFLKMRYKLPESDVSQLIERPVTADVVYNDISAVSDDMRFAASVAAFGQKLKGSNYGAAMDWAAIAELARLGRGEDESGHRAEFIQLVKMAAMLVPDSVDDTAVPVPQQ